MKRRLAAMIVATAALCGCGPDPTRLAINLTTSAQANPNTEQQFSPTVVRIYELKSLDKFNTASFFQIYDNDTATLGADMLSRKELVMLPGEAKTIDSVADPATAFIGVLAAFRDLNGNNWRASLKVEPHERNRMLLGLQTSAVTLTKPKPSHFLWIF